MQPTLGIVNAHNYWLEVLMPNWCVFAAHPSAKNAFNLAASLWHVLEWIEKDAVHGFGGKTKSDIRHHFMSQCPNLGIMHDIVTMSKHITVGTPKGGFSSVAGEPYQLMLHKGREGMFPESASDFVIHMQDGSEARLLDAFKVVVDYWTEYFKIPRLPSST